MKPHLNTERLIATATMNSKRRPVLHAIVLTAITICSESDGDIRYRERGLNDPLTPRISETFPDKADGATRLLY